MQRKSKLNTNKFDIIDDSYWDIETGEYAGPVDGWIGEVLETEDQILLAMQRLLKYETELKAEQLAMQSVVDRCKAMVKDRERKVQWFQNKYGEQVAAFARLRLYGKTKTWRCPWGQVSFRKPSPTFMIVQDEKALDLVPQEAVKIEMSILKSKIPKEIQLTLIEQFPDVFCMSNPDETFTVKSLTASDTEEKE